MVHNTCIYKLHSIYDNLLYRLLLAALHYNENSNRRHAITADGDKRYKIVYPKFKQGGYSVRPIQVDTTFSEYPESNIFLKTSDSSLKNSWATYSPGNSNCLEIGVID